MTVDVNREISPETIKQELPAAVCEQQHTDLRRIISTSRVPVEGKSSVCLICMKYRIIILIIIIISLDKILSSYISHITRTVVIITHYKRMGYVIIPKPNVSGREGISSRCRRFYLLPFLPVCGDHP